MQGDPGTSILGGLQEQLALTFKLPLPEQELGPCAPWSPSNLRFFLESLILPLWNLAEQITWQHLSF